MTPRHRDFVQKIIWPIAMANKEAVIADPMVLERLVNFRVEKNYAETRVDAAVKAMPDNEREIVLFGKRFWPRDDSQDYSYDECRAAGRFFRDLLHLCEMSTGLDNPGSRAMGIRASTRAVQRFLNRNVVILIDAISIAMENNPDGKCEWPPQPADGKW